MTNELLADSDANIASTLIEWIGDEARVTENNLIMGQIKTKEEVELNGLDDIKKFSMLPSDPHLSSLPESLPMMMDYSI